MIEDDVNIGANSVIIAPAGRGIRIGRGARVGAGAVVATDVPPGATVLSAPSRILRVEDADGGTLDGRQAGADTTDEE